MLAPQQAGAADLAIVAVVADIPRSIGDDVRRCCLSLPEAFEHVGSNHLMFKIGRRTFVNLIAVEDGAGKMISVLTARVPESEQAALLAVGHPFFQPRSASAADWIGMILDDETDWTEVLEIATDSFCLAAPKRLVQQVMPEDADDMS